MPNNSKGVGIMNSLANILSGEPGPKEKPKSSPEPEKFNTKPIDLEQEAKDESKKVKPIRIPSKLSELQSGIKKDWLKGK